MSKVQEYLKRKKIKELNLPKLYIVKSTPSGIEKPIGRQVIEIIENVAFLIEGNSRFPIDRYKIEEDPYEVDIMRGEKSKKSDGYGTGIGDNWCWTYFSFFSKEDAEKYYQQEIKK